MSKSIIHVDSIIFFLLTTAVQVAVAPVELYGYMLHMYYSLAKSNLFAQTAYLTIVVDIFNSGFCQLHLVLDLVNHSIVSQISLIISIHHELNLSYN